MNSQGTATSNSSSAAVGIPDLSIIIPAYNEEARLPRALGRIRDYFSNPRSPFSLDRIEILVVDDGSTDWTPRIVEEWSRTMPSLRLVSNGDNRGKGYSVRHGMLEARGRLALFTDADLSSPIEELEKLLIAIEIGNDAAIGGLKVVAQNGWFAARPSGTENIYKIYAESFRDQAHLDAIVAEAQQIVTVALT